MVEELRLTEEPARLPHRIRSLEWKAYSRIILARLVQFLGLKQTTSAAAHVH
jgi:hypothetical protein